MDNTYQISVVIPNYNRADRLKLAIESVLQQSLPALEILVCDDGSTDNSQSVVNSFDNKRVKWLSCGKNGRPAIPRNKGIQAAKGNLIAFLDNDDTWHPKKLELQTEEIKKGFNMVCCNAMRIVDGKAISKLHATKGDSTFNFYQMISTNQVVCSSVLLTKVLALEAAGFPETEKLKALEDYALWLRISTLSEIRYLDATLVNYTDEATTGIRKDSLSTAEQMKLIYEDFSAWLYNKPGSDKHVFEMAREVLLRRYLSDSQKFLHRLFHP